MSLNNSQVLLSLFISCCAFKCIKTVFVPGNPTPSTTQASFSFIEIDFVPHEHWIQEKEKNVNGSSEVGREHT